MSKSTAAATARARRQQVERQAEPILKVVEHLHAANQLQPQTRDFLRQMVGSMAPDVLKMRIGKRDGNEAKYVRYDFDPSEHPEQLELIQITDMQFGSTACKVERVIEYRDWVLASPHRFMLWCGDNVDAATMFSPGTPWDNMFQPISQVMRFCEIWAPARHRILGYVGGNHERRSIPAFGDLGTLIATLLGIPYSRGRQLLDIYYGDWAPFKITLWHGVGGARTKGTVAQILSRLMALGDSDLYLMGHVHQALTMPDFHEFRDQENLDIIVQKSVGAVGSSFLNTFGSYGEVAGFNSADVVMARAVLEPDRKWELTLR